MYRTVDAEFWHDAWVMTLPAEAKYLFLYLVTNHRTTACGAFEVSTRTIARETGLTVPAIETALALMAPKVMYWPDLDTVWVRRFYKRQRATSSDKFTVSAAKALTVFPPCVQQVVCAEYPELQGTTPAPAPPGIPSEIPTAVPSEIPSPNKDNSKQITDNSQQITIIPPTPQAVIAPPDAAAHAAGGSKTPTVKTKKTRATKTRTTPAAGFDWPGLWALITAQQGYKPTWNYQHETEAVKRLLTAHPSAQPADFARFLAFVGTCWPFADEPTRQPTFTEGAKHFGAWYTHNQPTAATPLVKGPSYASPTAAERQSASVSKWARLIEDASDPPEPERGLRLLRADSA